MSKKLEIRLTPLEPFFFGNDRTFFYGEDDIKRVGRRSYYVRSEKTPLQTTLFGVLRYLGIREVKNNYDISEDKANIGSASFSYTDKAQTFGRIQSISPLYLTTDGGEIYMPVPADHKISESEYSPFGDYKEVNTTVGIQYLPMDYDVKAGLAHGFINVKTGKVISDDDIFYGEVKTGIDINREKEGYYKMEYIRMNPDFSFAFQATVEDEFPETEKRIVYMGGKKSAFIASVDKTEKASPEENFRSLLQNHARPILYVASDSILHDTNGIAGIEAVENNSVFSVVDYKTAREYVTNYGERKQKDRFTKSQRLYRLIRAGSIFIPKPGKVEEISNLFKDEHFNIIGMNHYIMGGSDK